MQFSHGQSRLSAIQPAYEDNNNDSIINQLNLLHNGFESRVLKIQSFLYAPETPAPQPHNNNRYSFLHDFQGNIIPAIENRQLSPYNLMAGQKSSMRKDVPLSTRMTNPKAEQRRQGKKSIREQIMQENQILERRLSLNKRYMSSFPLAARQPLPGNNHNAFDPMICEKMIPSSKIDELVVGKSDEVMLRLQQQYNRSKVVKLYNFILRQVARCARCDGLRIHLGREGTGVALKCKQCDQGQHPLVGVLYDLENKGRFQQEIAAFQTAIDNIAFQLAALHQQTQKLQSLKEKVTALKNLNRKKYKEINESKFFLRKHLPNLQQAHLIQLTRLLPKEYLEQLDLWTQIQHQHGKSLQGAASALTRIMPAHLLDPNSSTLVTSLHRLLNYEKEQAVKISVSENIEFPMKRMECAVFVVDGTYSLPVFEDVGHLQLQFQNKKTLRELNLLFINFPRQVHSLAFNYNHKVNSHISAQSFPFLKVVSSLPAVEKLHVVIENVKDFGDLLEMAVVMTPKRELKVSVSKHIFSKNSLNLPLTYYHTLFGKLGSKITKIELDLPESIDSPAIVNYQQLLSLKFLTSFKLKRGDKQSKHSRKMKLLEAESIEIEQKKQLILKKTMARKATCLHAIKRLSNSCQNGKTAIQAVLMFLL